MNSIEQDLVAALAEIQNPPLDGKAAYGKYATIQSCLRAAKGVLPKHNLGIMQFFHTDPDRLITRIVHASGNFIEDGGVPLHCVDKTNPQKLMGAGTYARRAGLCSALGIAGEEDDDGQRATPRDELPESSERFISSTSTPPAAEPKPPVIVENIEDTINFDKPGETADEKTDVQKPPWGFFETPQAWIADQIEGFEKHTTTAPHRAWVSTASVQLDLLAREYPALHADLLKTWLDKKDELEGKPKQRNK